MTAKEKRTKALAKLKKMRYWMTFGYALIVILALGAVAVTSAFKYQDVVKAQTSSLTSSLNVQLKLNLENYLARMESIGTMAFSIDDAYTYDPTTSNLEEYDAINMEKGISQELSRLYLMENFVDYGIVYRNNNTVGKISNGTLSLFGNDMFIDFQAMISRDRTNDGWYTGYKSDYDRIYYVKQIHENALLVMSFYTTELEYVFDNPETMKDMTIRLTDGNYKIIYSSEKDELGQPLPAEISKQVQGSTDATVFDDYLTTINTYDVNWHIVCSIPKDVILSSVKQTRAFIRVITVIAALLTIVAGSVFTFMLSDPISMIALNMEDDEKKEENS